MSAPSYETPLEDKRWMEDFGCNKIVEERLSSFSPEQHLWEDMIEQLEDGDTLVISKLSNALLSLTQLVCLLELIKLKSIRLISIHDMIDSEGVLFPETTTKDILKTIASLHKEVRAVLRMIDLPYTNTTLFNHPKTFKNKISKEKRNLKILRMYKEKRTIPDIMASCGFKSRSSLYRVLKILGAELRQTRSK